MTNVLTQNAHPIVYDAYNICELVEKSKLSSFSIRMIQEICFSFGLDISNIELSEESSSTLTLTLRGLVKSCKWHTDNNDRDSRDTPQ